MREAQREVLTHRRICHAPSHLVGTSIGCWTIASCEATRRRHFHFIGWIHRHGTHASARRKIFFEFQRFSRAFKWSWRINFADFSLHFHGRKNDLNLFLQLLLRKIVDRISALFLFRFVCVTFIKIPFSLHHQFNFIC